LQLQQLTFLQARAFFKERGVTVALFQPIDITTAAEKKVIGFDSENALTYTKKGVDPAGRSDVTYNDNCAPYIETVSISPFLIILSFNFGFSCAGQARGIQH
jgi:hypothetical protein